MKTVIHDLSEEDFEKFGFPVEEQDYVISSMDSHRNCIGCFGCWTKTPGECVRKDGYEKIGEMLAKSEKLVMISKCTYGGYSPSVKALVDRSISFLLPFFVTRKDETHHKPRYRHTYSIEVFFYGENLSDREKEIARALVEANNKNFYVKQSQVHFFSHKEGFDYLSVMQEGECI